MQFADTLCLIFLTITVAVSSIEVDNKITIGRREIRLPKRHNRRDPIVMIETPVDGTFRKSQVIYRRVSPSERFVPPNLNYGVPRPRYKRPQKYPRKPSKRPNHRPKHVGSKYLPPNNRHKKRNSKPRYGLPFKTHKPKFPSLVKQTPYPLQQQTASAPATGFGEPPTSYANDNRPTKQSYGEPPVDSYGVPLKTNSEAVPSTPQNFQENTNDDEDETYQLLQSFPGWNHNKDTDFAFSNKHPSYSKPDPDDETFIAPTSVDYNDDFDKPDALQMKLKDKRYLRKNPFYFFDSTIKVNRPFRGPKKPDVSAEIVVGGHYAEPPPRYVAKFKPSAPMFDDNQDGFVPYHGFDHHKFNSPYLNYKHSNVAFSPQNLNDAFSIVK